MMAKAEANATSCKYVFDQ